MATFSKRIPQSTQNFIYLPTLSWSTVFVLIFWASLIRENERKSFYIPNNICFERYIFFLLFTCVIFSLVYTWRFKRKVLSVLKSLVKYYWNKKVKKKLSDDWDIKMANFMPYIRCEKVSNNMLLWLIGEAWDSRHVRDIKLTQTEKNETRTAPKKRKLICHNFPRHFSFAQKSRNVIKHLRLHPERSERLKKITIVLIQPQLVTCVQ